MTENTHSAVGPALGYYYQAIYALKVLFEEDDINSCISIETLDDVVIENGSQKELHQLKHSIQKNTKLSIKSDNIWKTLGIWSEYLKFESGENFIFTLSTVAEIDKSNSLSILLNFGTDRSDLLIELNNEANRILNEREFVRLKNNSISSPDKNTKLPYENRFKGCEAFLNLSETKRKLLIDRIILNPGSFSIDGAIEMVCGKIKNTVKVEDKETLAKSIIAWWDREAVESLTGERRRQIYKTELLEFISRKNAEMYRDLFTDDLAELSIPKLLNPSPIHQKQLEIISASEAQKRRSYDTEIKARIQREFWMTNKISTVERLKKYDGLLINEWSYMFDEICAEAEVLPDSEIQKKGRELLDWSHTQAHNQVQPISNSYRNPDLIRGSYQMLSSIMEIGWHVNYKKLINDIDGKS